MNYKIAFILLAIITSCNNSQETKVVSNPTVSPETMKKDSITETKIIIKESDLADQKDLVCGMPAFRYLADTAVYKGKIYGFCSEDCKDEFLKDPASFITKK